ncbi:hypothetical protein QCA50_011384 [Cerrena zonata]|uniref:Uncharacterized protein n=1 Tax=Cerrena zonata TaxID=2478898 RepID=A0AAW0G6C9_9APHY
MVVVDKCATPGLRGKIRFDLRTDSGLVTIIPWLSPWTGLHGVSTWSLKPFLGALRSTQPPRHAELCYAEDMSVIERYTAHSQQQ